MAIPRWVAVDADGIAHQPKPSEQVLVDRYITVVKVDYNDDDYDEQRRAALTNIFGQVVVRAMCGSIWDTREIIDFGQITCIGCLGA